MTVTAQPTPSSPPARLQIRKNVSQLSEAELAALRKAIEMALERKDTRGFEYFAGWHGVALGWCEHHNPLFLPWHRAYLHYFELALQDCVAGVTLPWWDWTTEAQIPDSYAVAKVAGQENVLASLPISVFGASPKPSWPKRTSREPGAFPEVPSPPYKAEWNHAMAATSYTDFNSRLWQVHDTVHVWVGGTMGQVDWAAYDPLFWAHHANVDRAWRIWQHTHAGADPPAGILDVPMRVAPSMTARATLDVKQLGYEYAGSEASVPGTVA
jgi:tyrosinase